MPSVNIKSILAKKSVRIVGIIVAAIVAIPVILFLSAVWFLSSKNLAPYAEKMVNQHIEGEMKMNELRVSLRSGLFVVGVEVDSLTVVSKAFKSLSKQEAGDMPQYADSLISLDHLSGELDIKRLIFNRQLSLNDVAIHGLGVNVVIARNGKANYDIAKNSSAAKSSESKPPSFRLNHFSLLKPKEIRFYNASDSTSASAVLLTDASIDGHEQPTYRLKISGNLSSHKAAMFTNLDQISFGMNGKLRWDPESPGLLAMDEMELTGAFVKAVVTGEVDFTNHPIIKKGLVNLRPVALVDLLTLLPDSVRQCHGLFMPNFSSDAEIRGKLELTKPFDLTTDSFPSSILDISISPAYLNYGKARLSNLALNATVKTITNMPDSMTIDIRKFTIDGPGTRFKASAVVSHPVSDPAFQTVMEGRIDINDLPPILLEQIPGYLEGVVSANLNASGSKSMLKPDRLHLLAADGNLTADKVYYISADTSKMVQLGKVKMDFGDHEESVKQLKMKLDVDTATVLVSGIDLTFGKVQLATDMSRLMSDLKVRHFNVTTLKDSAGARIRDIAGHINMKGKLEPGKLPQISAKLVTGFVSAGTRSDRILIRDAKIDAWLHRVLYQKVNHTQPHRSAGKHISYLSPQRVRKYVKWKRSHGKHIRRVYGAQGEDDEELLVWNLNPHFNKFLNEWKIKGSVKTNKARLLTPLFPMQNRFSTIDLRFNNDTVNISDISFLAGGSDLNISGIVTNIRRALTSSADNNLRGNLAVSSDLIDINELSSAVFIGAAYESDKRHGKKRVFHAKDDRALSESLDRFSKEEAGKVAPVLIPVNVDANVKLNADRLLYSDFEMKNAGGDILVFDGGVNIHDLKAESDVGNLSMSALYSAPKISDMEFGLGLEASDFNIGKLAKLIPALDSITPLLHDFSGMVSADIAATCKIDSGMNINLPSLNAAVRIKGDNLAFIDSVKYHTLGKWLGFKNKEDNTIHSLNVNITIQDGLLRVYPFAFNIDRYRLGVFGSNNIDMDFDYHVSVLKSPLPFKFGITLKGNPKKYKVRFGGAKFREDRAVESVDIVDNVRLNLLDQIQNVFISGVRNSRLSKLKIAAPASFGEEADGGELTSADSLLLIQEGLIEGPAGSKVVAPQKKKKHKRFWLF